MKDRQGSSFLRRHFCHCVRSIFIIHGSSMLHVRPPVRGITLLNQAILPLSLLGTYGLYGLLPRLEQRPGGGFMAEFGYSHFGL